MDVSFVAAFAAGMLSFLSPCVLPLVPPYLCFLAGTTIEEITEEHGAAGAVRRDVILTAFAFVAGFSTVFVLLGATASLLGQILRQYLWVLSWGAGIAIIVMGVHFLGLFRIGMLFREKRLHVGAPAGPAGAYMMGLAFAFGWTPCIGPILAAILAVASSRETLGHGMALLATYSAGLGLPFVVAALGIERFIGFARGFGGRYRQVEIAMGGLLVLTGLAFLTGGMERMAFWIIETFPALGRLG